MNTYSHEFFIKCIYLQAPLCGANAHTDAEQRKQNKTGTWGQKNNCPQQNLAHMIRKRTEHNHPNHS